VDDPGEEFPIVGIGASAGGLAAFEQLFTHLPPKSGMAYVVVQHLSPPHKSILPEILQRYTSMPVSQVTDGVEVEPNTVYVIPPGSDLALRGGRLRLTRSGSGRELRLPIDFLFRSLAEDQGERSIGIVLSGTGSDGSLGLKNIKAEGGLTIAQEPDTAEFSDMPRSAIATHDVDFILPPAKMGDLIQKYVGHQVLDSYPHSESEAQIPVGGLQKLYHLLRSKTGNDFSLYKQSTLQRRIERRMKISLVKDMDEYLRYLNAHPEEIEALFQEMLINVTHFFRDPEAFNVLAEKAIRPLVVQKHAARAPIRVWVTGCSTGEEAYSLAIIIQEQLQALNANCKVQVYATDLDAKAIEIARRGFYTDGSLENVSAERLQAFFQQEEEGYQIKKSIRDVMVFSTQNMISDPSFSRMDLVSCRNVLIYLEPVLQHQLFLQFHYALNPDGILFLGNSESLGGSKDLFVAVDRKYKIFRRKDMVAPDQFQPRNRLRQRDALTAAPGAELHAPQSGGLRDRVEKALLEEHTPPCVVIDQKHSVLYIHGRTGKYLEPVMGEVNNNIIRMAREGLKTELASALHTVASLRKTVRREGIQVKTNGDYQAINLTVRLLDGPPDTPDLILVIFEDISTIRHEPLGSGSSGKRGNRRIVQLETAFKEKDEYLHTVINELEETNQDLKATNEELQAANEEMQSANEELETSKEELQSINEELNTINAELQSKNEELGRINNDIFNLLTSTEIATIFLDLDLQIRRYTPAIQRIYKFLPTDIGRPIAHIVSSLDYPNLIADIQQVLDDLVPKSTEVVAKDGTWYLINIKPYRTLERVIDGAVITFVDITDQKRGDVLRRLGTILHDSNDAITMQDFSGNILAWNRGASQMYGWTEYEALQMNILSIVPEAKREEIQNIYRQLSKGETIQPFETQRITRDGRILNIWLTLTTLFNDAKQPVTIASTERDISGRKQPER
jgi:two-component system CheB/CheR fusion protein